MLLGFCWWETTVASGRKWLEQGERADLVEACRQVDPGQTGRIPISEMGKVLGAVGSEVSPFALSRTTLNACDAMTSNDLSLARVF